MLVSPHFSMRVGKSDWQAKICYKILYSEHCTSHCSCNSGYLTELLCCHWFIELGKFPPLIGSAYFISTKIMLSLLRIHAFTIIVFFLFSEIQICAYHFFFNEKHKLKRHRVMKYLYVLKGRSVSLLALGMVTVFHSL